MIVLTKLGGRPLMINEELIETVSETPDTVITMNNGHTYIVTESIDEIMEKVIDFNRMSHRSLRLKKSENEL